MNVEGQEFIESITEVEIGKSPYPGIHIELEPQRPTYPDTRFQITASGGKIYPERFGIPFSVRINYKDGSFEYYTDEFDVWPLKALVADRPAEPVITETPYRTTVTTTVSAQPVTTTVSAQPVTTTRTQVEEAGSSTGRIVGVLLGVLAALGIAAGSMFFAFENGLL